jgi:hypothetical protein
MEGILPTCLSLSDTWPGLRPRPRFLREERKHARTRYNHLVTLVDLRGARLSDALSPRDVCCCFTGLSGPVATRVSNSSTWTQVSHRCQETYTAIVARCSHPFNRLAFTRRLWFTLRKKKKKKKLFRQFQLEYLFANNFRLIIFALPSYLQTANIDNAAEYIACFSTSRLLLGILQVPSSLGL